MTPRPECIRHYGEIRLADDNHYPDSDELLSLGSPFARALGLTKIGIHHEELPPGRRTSWPHAERSEDEFVYVIEGCPDVWIDGHLHALRPGDGVGFPSGTGIAHTFINNTEERVRLLVVGEASRDDNLCIYPLDDARNAAIGDFLWRDAPERELGPHDGLPDALREGASSAPRTRPAHPASAVAPILPVRDVAAAIAHYEALGYTASAWGGEGELIYAFVCLGPVELHLTRTADLDPEANTSAVYVYVADADALHSAWRASDAGGQTSEPADTPWGLREFTHLDPDGNLLRIGSPLA